MIRIVLLLLVCCSTLQTAYTQKLSKLERMLDSVPYYNLIDVDYTMDLQVSDTIKRKVVSILNGYLPHQVIQEATGIPEQVAQNIRSKALSIVGEDSIRYIQTIDSLTEIYRNKNLEIHRNRAYSENFILAIGSWGIREAKSILLTNLNNPRFPKIPTLLTLSKLGESKVQDTLMQILKVRDTTFVEIMPRGYISKQKELLLKSGMYLKNKELISMIVDLLNVKGNTVLFDKETPVPSELLTMLELSLCFMERKYIENGAILEWEKITDQFFDAINESRSDPKRLDLILSDTNKVRVKEQMRAWIEKYVTF